MVGMEGERGRVEISLSPVGAWQCHERVVKRRYVEKYGQKRRNRRIFGAGAGHAANGVSLSGDIFAGRKERWRNRAALQGASQHDVHASRNSRARRTDRFRERGPRGYLQRRHLRIARIGRISRQGVLRRQAGNLRRSICRCNLRACAEIGAGSWISLTMSCFFARTTRRARCSPRRS